MFRHRYPSIRENVSDETTLYQPSPQHPDHRRKKEDGEESADGHHPGDKEPDRNIRGQWRKYHDRKGRGEEDGVSDNPLARPCRRPENRPLNIPILCISLLKPPDKVDGEVNRHPEGEGGEHRDRHIKVLAYEADESVNQEYRKEERDVTHYPPFKRPEVKY